MTNLISRLGKIRLETKALSYGGYKELLLTNCQYAFARDHNGQSVLVTVNNSDNDFLMNLPVQNIEEYVGGLSGEKVLVKDGYISVNVKANSGEIWLPACQADKQIQPIKLNIVEKPVEIENAQTAVEITEPTKEKTSVIIEKDSEVKCNKTYEEMTVEELQEAILERMKHNGPVTEQMKKDVYENVYHNSLVTWVKSFN